MLPGTSSTSVGLATPNSSAADIVTILLTEPGSNGLLTAGFAQLFGGCRPEVLRVERLAGGQREHLAGLHVQDHHRRIALGPGLRDVVAERLLHRVLQVGVQRQLHGGALDGRALEALAAGDDRVAALGRVDDLEPVEPREQVVLRALQPDPAREPSGRGVPRGGAQRRWPPRPPPGTGGPPGARSPAPGTGRAGRRRRRGRRSTRARRSPCRSRAAPRPWAGPRRSPARRRPPSPPCTEPRLLGAPTGSGAGWSRRRWTPR